MFSKKQSRAVVKTQDAAQNLASLVFLSVGFSCWSLSELIIVDHLMSSTTSLAEVSVPCSGLYSLVCLLCALGVFLCSKALENGHSQTKLAVLASLCCAASIFLCWTERGDVQMAGLIFYAIGSTLLLFAWLDALSPLHLLSTIKVLVASVAIGVVLRQIVASFLFSPLSVTPLIAASMGALLLLQKNPPRSVSQRYARVLKPSKLIAPLGALSIIGFISACSQQIALGQDSLAYTPNPFPDLSFAVSALVLAILFFAFKDIDLTVSVKVIATFAIASLLFVLCRADLSSLAYFLASISYIALSYTAYYVALLAAKSHPSRRLQTFAIAQCVLMASAIPLVIFDLVGIDITSRGFIAALIFTFSCASLWLMNDRIIDSFLSDEKRDIPKMSSASDAVSCFASEKSLTQREQDVLRLFAIGRSARFIAEELVLSENTVKSHLQRIYSKCGVHSKQELISLVFSEAQTDNSNRSK